MVIQSFVSNTGVIINNNIGNINVGSNNLSPGRYTSRTSIDLPVKSDLLFLLARGNRIFGSVEFTDDGESPDNIRVDVVARYDSPAAFERATASKLERGQGREGVGIFTPDGDISYGANRIQFELTVRFPSTAARGEQTKLPIKAFETDLPMFSHRVGDLGKSTRFQSLVLKSSNASISVGSLGVSTCIISTTNGTVSGRFKTDRYVGLFSSNGGIDVDVNICDQNAGYVPELVMNTMNGRIRSGISLRSTARDNYGGSFKINARTLNANVSLSIPVAPVDSIIDLAAKTVNARADVTMPSTYAGFFSISTCNSRVNVEDQRPLNQTGRGEGRSIWWTRRSSTFASGKVGWNASISGPRSQRQGGVDVSTVNASASLRL